MSRESLLGFFIWAWVQRLYHRMQSGVQVLRGIVCTLIRCSSSKFDFASSHKGSTKLCFTRYFLLLVGQWSLIALIECIVIRCNCPNGHKTLSGMYGTTYTMTTIIECQVDAHTPSISIWLYVVHRTSFVVTTSNRTRYSTKFWQDFVPSSSNC